MNNINATIIKLLLLKEIWKKYNKKIHNKEVFKYLQVIESLHSATEEDISFSEFRALMLIKDEKASEWLDQAEKADISEVVADKVFETWLHKEWANSLALKAIDMVEGRQAYEDVKEVFDSYLDNTTYEDLFVTGDFERLWEKNRRDGGILWRTKSLNEAIGGLRKGDFGFFFARTNIGKCFAKGTSVLMYNGSKKNIEDIVDGDLVMGQDSTPRTVQGVTRGTEELFRVSYPRGVGSYTVNASHILTLHNTKGEIVNIEVKDYIKQSKFFKKWNRGYKVGIDFPQKEVKLDPYFLGVWLGDGTSSKVEITSMDKEVIDYCISHAESLGLRGYAVERPSQGKALTVCSVNQKGSSNILIDIMRDMGLLNNKHIPKDYLINSREIRLNLLAGLLDTDGYRGEAHYEVVQVRESLANEILWLARSLGIHGNITRKVVNSKLYYRVFLYGDLTAIPLKVEHKKYVRPSNLKRKNLDFILKVESVGIGDYYGFTLKESPYFVLNDFSVVHNTSLIANEISYMIKQVENPVLYCSNEESGERIYFRIAESFFGVDRERLGSNLKKAEEAFVTGTGGRLKIYEPAGMSIWDIEKTAAMLNPSLIIIDNLDKVYGFKNERDDLRLGKLYQWARELAKKYAPVIAVCQAGASAEGKKWLQITDIDCSHTSKQKEADWIIGMGISTDAGCDNIRYFNLVKNKFGSGKSKFSSKFNSAISRFEEMK